MTVEQRAARTFGQVVAICPGGLEAITVALREAIAEEREACARIAESQEETERGSMEGDAYLYLAEVIRSRAIAETVLADGGATWGPTAKRQIAEIEKQRQDIQQRYGGAVASAMIAVIRLRARAIPPNPTTPPPAEGESPPRAGSPPRP